MTNLVANKYPGKKRDKSKARALKIASTKGPKISIFLSQDDGDASPKQQLEDSAHKSMDSFTNNKMDAKAAWPNEQDVSRRTKITLPAPAQPEQISKQMSGHATQSIKLQPPDESQQAYGTPNAHKYKKLMKCKRI